MTDLGTRLTQLENRLNRLERAPRLSSAAIDDTSLVIRDGSGSLRALVGQQPDGTTAVNVVNGPTPPTPAAPYVASVLGGVAAAWDGTFTNDQVLPLDFARVEVHASTTADFDPIAATLMGTIETPQGAVVVITTDTPVYVRLVTRNTSGTASAPSAQNGPIAPALVVADDVADGIITGTKLAADAIDGKVITGATLRTAATGERIVLSPDGVITIYNADGVIVVEIDAAGYRLFDEAGTLVAEIRLTSDGGLGGFWTRNFSFPEPVASFLNGGRLEFEPVTPSLVDTTSSIDYSVAPEAATPFTQLSLNTGEIDSALDSQMVFNLLAERGQTPKAQAFGDLEVSERVRIDGVDQGKGLRAWEGTQTSTSTTTTTEIAAITTDTITFEAGRAYAIHYHGLLISSVANDIVRARVWRGSIGGGGVSLVDSINAYHVPVANQHVLMDMCQRVVNSTGSDVTGILIGSVLRTVGSGNVQLVANANNPAWLEVRDIGLASDYPLARAI
ncbi:hypothetical protein [Streptomyces sp. NPDC047981]|uniref:hypothetical protein n=1 Tax=Streptomyces sp. NPDC047981 TaxID=3154610 RepID=UPI00343665C8